MKGVGKRRMSKNHLCKHIDIDKEGLDQVKIHSLKGDHSLW